MALSSLAGGLGRGQADFDPGSGEDQKEVCEFTEGEHCTAEYQTESSTNVTE